MSEIINRKEQPSRSTDIQEAVVIDDIEDAMKRLKISPRKVLGSLSHLRIDRARIKPIEGQAPKAGGKADVEAAMLISEKSSSSSESDVTEYVAVKKLRFDATSSDDRALAPLAHEVDLLNDLSHENVVGIVGFVEDVEEGVAWMVFVWEKNGNLREFIRSAEWELPERISLLNILVNSENRAVITDFGSARAVDSAEEEALKGVRAAKAVPTSHPAAMGPQEVGALTAEIAPSGEFITMTGPAWTVRWAAPELLEGYLPGLASDIWALGWVCWETITGHFPFQKENDFTVVLRVMKGDLPTIENDDQLKQIQTLCSLMRECWNLDINERATALRCHKDQTVPSRREASSSCVTRSSGLFFALGCIKMRKDMYAEAREYFGQSLKVAESVGDERGRARALKGIGSAFGLQDEYSKAEEAYIQARSIYSEIGDQLGLAGAVENLGDVYQSRSEYPKAEESYIQARDIYSRFGDQLGFARSVDSLGDVYCMRGEHSQAEDAYVQAREIYSQLGYLLGFAQSVKSLGNVYYMRGEHSQAEDFYIQARDVYSQIGERLGFAQSLHGLGDLYRSRGEYSKAEESYLQAREIYSRIGNQLGFAHSFEGMGQVYAARREHAKAEESYTEAGRLYRQIGDMHAFAHISWYLGGLHREQAQYETAQRLV
ncbi:hypothetical protein FS837_012035 [Tulasnella sp. UAMH 9824]|nr:hypothetical protein FS837_012035 [Tulasnella sp. UAMH 9824]